MADSGADEDIEAFGRSLGGQWPADIPLRDAQPCRRDGREHVVAIVQHEVEIDWGTEQFVAVVDRVADMHRERQQPVRRQNPALPKGECGLGVRVAAWLRVEAFR